MQFHSTQFLFFFLPLFLAVYYLFPRRWRSGILLLGSLVFYWLSCGGALRPICAALGVTVMTWLVGKAAKRRRWLLVMYLLALFSGLFFLKLWRGGAYLPAGMSFYLFYLAAWLVQLHRGEIRRAKGLAGFASDTLMFPKLLSGPIVDPAQLEAQDASWDHPGEYFHSGLQTLVLGLAIKVLVADPLAGLWAQAAIAGYESISTPYAWLALTGYALRLYLDFWGYSLMAVGLGEMLGFRLPENFADPYASKTVSEFYRRWHITLGLWFRRYVYIPLGGNRKGLARTVLNLAIVWLLTGLWHGTGANYLVWAGFLALLIINEKLWLGKLMQKTRLLGHLYTIFVILLSWLPFAIESRGELVMYFGRLFGFLGHAINPVDFLDPGRTYLPVVLGGVLLTTPWPGKLWRRIRGSRWADVLIFLLFWVCVYAIATSEQSPFLYFQY